MRAGTALDSEDRWQIARRLLHDDNTLELIDRITGSFALLYAQPLTRIAAMTTNSVDLDSNTVTVTFAVHPVEIPEPLATLITALAAGGHRQHVGIGATTTSPWLFPGHHPGRPITPSRLGDRLSPLGIDARAGRRAAFLQLASQLPAPVIADALSTPLSPSRAFDTVRILPSTGSNAGVHPKIISERLGHATINVTLDLYSYVSPAIERDVAETLSVEIPGEL